MNIKKSDLLNSAKEGIISNEQVESLWIYLSKNTKAKPVFSGINVTYYLGALLIISAMTWFATTAFSMFEAAGLAGISAIYILVLTLVGIKLHKNNDTYIPGGLLLSAALFIVPLFIFSIQKHFGVWTGNSPGDYKSYYHWVKSGWFVMEMATILVSLIYLYIFKFPFMTFPLAFTIWFLSMDIVPLIFGRGFGLYDERRFVSLIFGLILIFVGYIVDRKTKRDFSFWLYLFGLNAFCGGITVLWSDGDFGKLIYFIIHLVLILTSVLFDRVVFTVYGGIGAFSYLSYLSYELFANSILFPIVLSIVGLFIIWMGIFYSKKKEKISKFILNIVPENLTKLLPTYRK